MEHLIEFTLALFLITNLMMAASSRLMHCIKIVIIQGILLGILPLLLGHFEGSHLFAAFLNISIKGIALPWLLITAIKKADVCRELEPLVGYATSLIIVLLFFAVSFWLGTKLPASEPFLRLATPSAVATMLTGLFIVMARRKAITQAIGFLTFENGISLFGTGHMLDFGVAVEMGILLDVLVLVFVMGIAVMRIKREFQHIDSDKLHFLGDNQEEVK
ncbi:MAG: hydrogenase [Lentisphaeria bacterium]|nr:hydrogenase [Lentisphaeria bacterium]